MVSVTSSDSVLEESMYSSSKSSALCTLDNSSFRPGLLPVPLRLRASTLDPEEFKLGMVDEGVDGAGEEEEDATSPVSPLLEDFDLCLLPRFPRPRPAPAATPTLLPSSLEEERDRFPDLPLTRGVGEVDTGEGAPAGDMAELMIRSMEGSGFRTPSM